MGVASGIGMAALLILALEAATLLPLRARAVLLIYGAVLAVLVWLRRRELLSAKSLGIPLATGFAISMVSVFGVAVLDPVDRGQALLLTLEPTVIGWCAALALLPLMAGGVTEAPSPEWKPTARATWVFLAVAFTILAVVHELAVHDLAIASDEVVFLTQSRWMQFPQVAWQMDADLATFFRFRKVDFLNGHMYGMYPPGWPAMLAAFRYVGLEWWSSVIVATVGVALTYLLGTRLKGPRVGAIAAGLLATSQVFLANNAGYMSQAAGISTLLGATWCLLVGIDHRGWRRVLSWFGAGLLLGLAVSTRPLIALAIGLSIGTWMLARAWRVEPRAAFLMVACVAAGGLLPAWLFIEYNLAVFGRPIALGHEVMHPGLYSLGFGQRGFRVINENFEWEPASFYHGPLQGLRHLVRRVVGVNTTWMPVGMLVPIAALAVAAGYRFRWALVAVFSILPVALFFYWGPDLRQYGELMPFVFIGVAATLMAIHERWPRLTWGLVGTVLASHVILALPWPIRPNDGHRPWSNTDYSNLVAPGRWATLIAADSLARAHGRLLLFSHEQTKFDNQIDRLYIFNGDGFSGRILVARDLGPRNEELIKRFPDRTPYLVTDQGRDKTATFTPIAP